VLAGFIVTLIGLGIALVRTLQIPAYWIPPLVGVALLVAGAWRRGSSGSGGSGERASRS
jgi:hypothetical protein